MLTFVVLWAVGVAATVLTHTVLVRRGNIRPLAHTVPEAAHVFRTHESAVMLVAAVLVVVAWPVLWLIWAAMAIELVINRPQK